VVGWFRNHSSFPTKAGCPQNVNIDSGSHPASFSVYREPFLRGKAGGAWSRTPTSIQRQGLECVCICAITPTIRQITWIKLTSDSLYYWSLFPFCLKKTRFHSVPVSSWALHVGMVRWMRNVYLCFACLLGSNHLYEIRADWWGKGL